MSSSIPGASPTNIIGLFILPSPKTIFFELFFKLQSLIEFICNFNSLSSFSLSILTKSFSFLMIAGVIFQSIDRVFVKNKIRVQGV